MRFSPSSVKLIVLGSLAVVLSSLFFAHHAFTASSEGGEGGLSEFYRNFQQPPPAYSMVPLFRLNDKVNRGEVAWQLEEMKREGIDGMFILPESLAGDFGWKDAGMPYQYLSPGYFRVAREIAEEAKRAGIALWVYDELDWPSGQAGGKIEANPNYQGRVIQADTHTYEGPQSITLSINPGAGVVAALAFRQQNDRINPESIQDLTSSISADHLSWSVPPGKWQLAVYTLEVNPGLYQHADADLLNAQAMAEFIRLTHEQYLRQVQQPAGIHIQGTFTDEPHMPAFRNYIGNLPKLVYLPWSAALFENFRKWKGYDIRSRLPLLYENGGPETAKVRCDFWQVVARMFEENYFGQIAKFDHAAGWISTGHLNGEEGFWWHLIFDGGDEFANQREFDYPGLDWILPFDYSPHPGIGWLIPFAGKFVSSVAHVYSKRRVMEETFAGSGWGISFEQMHRMINWAYLLGVNMLVPITYKYSLRGEGRATSYPPGISYQQPWWSEMRPFSEYVSRLSYLLSQGHFQGQIAFLLPIPDVWANSPDREYVDDLTQKVHWVTNALLAAGYNFDFIDGDSLNRASIEGGKIAVGNEHYEALILPPVRVASKKTMQKVAEFHRQGGIVIGLNRLPSGSMERGDPDPAMTQTMRAIFGSNPGKGDPRTRLVYLDPSAKTVIEALHGLIERPLALGGAANGVYSMHRRIGSSDIFFLINSTSEDRGFGVAFRATGSPEIWDAETGARWSIPGAEIRNGRTVAHLLLRPYESLFVIFNTGLPAPPPYRWWNHPISSFELTGAWNFELDPTMMSPHVAWNFFPLPAGWKLKSKDYSKIHEITLGNWQERGLPYYSGKAIYEKTFSFEKLGANQRYLLDLGKVGIAARVWLNGRLVGSRLWGPYTFDVTDFLVSGKNTLRVSVVNTLANYFSQFDQLKNASLSRGGTQPWMLPSGLMGPVSIRGYSD